MRIEAVRLHRVRLPFKGGTSFVVDGSDAAESGPAVLSSLR